MKKQLKKFLCNILSLVMLLSCTSVFAETSESPMGIKWRGDYSDNADPKLIVEFKSPAPYKQQVTVVIYPADETNPDYPDYVYIKEFSVKEGETKKITLSILDTYDSLIAPDGNYTVALQGNGNMSDLCKDSETVYVKNPSAIPGLLTEFKNATTAASFSSVLEKVEQALQLVAEPDTPDGAVREEKRINIMLKIQEKDYNGTFLTLENIRDAWNVSDAISYITDAGATKEGLKSKIEANSAVLGIDTTDADYIAYIDAVCQDILSYSSDYNAGAGVQSIKDLYGIIKQYIGMHAVNAATEETIYGVFDTYKNYFEIPSATLLTYNGWEEGDCEKALRLLYNKNFTKNSELVAAFIEGVNGVTNNPGNTDTETPTPTPPSNNDNESPSSSMTGAVGGSTTPQPPQNPTGFKDVPSSHWAYAYIEKLAANGTISGYGDGTFKPNNNVTREEFIKMIISATGLLSKYAECDFTDVSTDSWFYIYVASGVEKGIIGGMDNGAFGTGRNITRQDVAVIAARILTYLNAQIPETAEVTLTDFDTVSDYAQESVKHLNGMGIIAGFDDGSFMPHNALTRAEAAAIISRLTANL